MATPQGSDFSTVENQVSQCDEQTFGSTSEFKKAGVARAPLAKSSKQVSVETDEALRACHGPLAQQGSRPAMQKSES